MKKSLLLVTALLAFACFGGVAQAHYIDADDAESIIEDLADYEIESGDLIDYEITDSEEVSDHKVIVSIDTLEVDGSECSADMVVKLRGSRGNKVTVKRTNLECF